MASENIEASNLFKDIEFKSESQEIEFEDENNNEKLLLALFQEIETDLLDALVHRDGSESDDETDGPISFIKNILESVKKDFENIKLDEERKNFLNTLTKIFATLLSVKAFFSQSLFINSKKVMVRTKLVPKRITLALQRNRFTEYKITILPEQKSIQIKKNGQVVRTVTRKTQRITDGWARNF